MDIFSSLPCLVFYNIPFKKGCPSNIPLNSVDKGLRLLQPLLHTSGPLLPTAIDRRHGQRDGWGSLLLAPSTKAYCFVIESVHKHGIIFEYLWPFDDLLSIHFKCPFLKHFDILLRQFSRLSSCATELFDHRDVLLQEALP